MLPQDIQDSLHQELNLAVHNTHSLTGGCIHQAAQLQTDQGTFFLKWNQLQQAHNLRVEAQGLSLLADTNTFHIPEIILQGESATHCYLLLEFISSAPRAANYWDYFGRTLAELHLHTQSYYGLPYDNYIGALPQVNTPSDHWVSFFRDKRLRPMIKRAKDKSLLPMSVAKAFDELFIKLPELLPSEKPSCLHGDLWGGNIIVNPNGLPTLIDPAVYYGYREIELAFMTLFDRQPSRFYESYQEIYPLHPGWIDRMALYNLYPLLVHLNLFGAGYLNSIQNTLKHYV